MARTRGSLAPLTGLAFVVLMVLSFIMAGEVPDVDDPAQDVVSYFEDKESQVELGAILTGIGAVFFLFFVGFLRRVLRAGEGPNGWLSAVAAGGGIVAATGVLIFAGLGFTLAGASGHLSPESIQTLNALSVNLFFPLAGGIATFFFAAGLSSLRSKALPPWLAWAALVIAVVTLSPLGFFAFLAALLWVLVISIWLPLGERPAPEGTPVP